MSTLRYELIYATKNRIIMLTDTNIHNDIHKRFKFQQQTLLADKILTSEEKTEAIRDLTENYDRNKIFYNDGTRRICENCNQKCLATLYCEYSDWINGEYDEWDSVKKQLIRLKNNNVILKKLENVESANQSWIEEAKSHLTISNKRAEIVQCYGLTQNSTNGNYMLVMMEMDIDLRKYLQQNHNQLTWKERIGIAYEIILALYRIHGENANHRDLHSGNILYSQPKIVPGTPLEYKNSMVQCWDADPLKRPDIYTFEKKMERIALDYQNMSDKSFQLEIDNLEMNKVKGNYTSSRLFTSKIHQFVENLPEPRNATEEEQEAFHSKSYDFSIPDDSKPKIVPGTPLEYKNLMIQCWDADPLKRLDVYALEGKMERITLDYQNMSDKSFQSEIDNLEMNKVRGNCTSSRLFTSKIHNFENLSEPRNATEEEQEAFHSKSYDFNIPDDINDFNGSNKQNSSKSSKVINSFKGSSKRLSKVFKKLQINSNNDDDDIHNNPNLHSKEQDEFEIPDDGF
ncbi:hypothetical protein RhiirB3_452927 [Rhizophagus irregularis]|nr:hypothetical protein RhiirB3_452927 [Rhizophagus irregularis]